MNFVTFQFITFLIIAVSIFILLDAHYRKYFLLACSYFFYGTWSIPLIGLILFSTSSDYYLGNKIYQTTCKNKRKLFLIISIIINCSILIFFKYFNFFLTSAHSLMALFGHHTDTPKLIKIILPLGVSFYTFEAISYICDIYRGEKPASNWLNYNFYIMYFPHLISGPIVRYKELYGQYENGIALPKIDRIKNGFQLLLYGFIFKLVIADSMASIANPLFINYQTINHLESWIASLAFTVQIYFDFLGYTHIARGVSLFFNIELPLNFNHPYNSKNISEFWQRWHITLSRWIRDYVYIPLGGSRDTLFKTVNNLSVTMFIAGLWHGASWNFAIWGLYHGLLLSIYHVYRTHFKKENSSWLNQRITTTFSIFVTFSCVVIGWVIFRSTSFGQAWILLKKMYDIPNLAQEIISNYHNSDYAYSFLTLACLVILCFIGPAAKAMEKKLLPTSQSFWLNKAIYSLCTIWVLIFMFSPITPFIYFVF